MKNKLLSLELPYMHYANFEDSIVVDAAERFSDNDFFCIIEGSKCVNKKNMFKEFAGKFSFPTFFGYNWDALDECMNDLEWLGKEAYIVFVKRADLILKRNDKDFRTLITILYHAIEEWVRGRTYNKSFPTSPTPFHIVFDLSTNNERIAEIGEITKAELNYISF